MQFFLSRKKRLIILIIFLIAGILGGFFLINAKESLSGSEMLLLIAGLILVCSIFEIFGIWWENSHKNPDENAEHIGIRGRVGIVEKECSPVGTVKIGIETWKAIAPQNEIIRSGEEIIVINRKGLSLYVERTS